MQDELMMANTGGDDETPNQRAARKRKELEAPIPAPAQPQVPKESKKASVLDYIESLLGQCYGCTG